MSGTIADDRRGAEARRGAKALLLGAALGGVLLWLAARRGLSR